MKDKPYYKYMNAGSPATWRHHYTAKQLGDSTKIWAVIIVALGIIMLLAK